MFHYTSRCLPVFLLIAITFFAFPNKTTTVEGAQTQRVINTGTVLFGASDLNRECWMSDNLALLTSRLIVENMLPHLEQQQIRDDGFVADIIEYFRLVLEVVRKMTSGKSKHIILLALSDAIGGYMKHLVLPMAKYAYYAGKIDYASVTKLYQLYDEIKSFLRTDGDGWANAPANLGKHVHAKPINLLSEPMAADDPCAGLVYVKKIERGACTLDIPMPFFDSKSHPSAIAVPFRSFTLRSLESHSAAYILVKYYLAAVRCMQAKHADPRSVESFHSKLFALIMGKVVPHLYDEKFYAGFGGVLRIVETIKQGQKSNVIGSFNIMPEQEERESDDVADDQQDPFAMNATGTTAANAAAGDNADMFGDAGDRGGSEVFRSVKRQRCDGDEAAELRDVEAINAHGNKSSLLLIAGLVTICVWFCLGAMFIWCKIRKGHSPVKFGDDHLKLLPCTTETCPERHKITRGTSGIALPPALKSSTGSSSKSRPSNEKTTSKTSGYSNECTNATCPAFAQNASSGKSTENEDGTSE